MLGESGTALSEGERQHLSIARALLKDAPVVLLDEATASLDPENETLVQKAVGTLCTGKTVIVIAHRLRAIANADIIVVLDGGNTVEDGTHDELISCSGLHLASLGAPAAERQPGHERAYDSGGTSSFWSIRFPHMNHLHHAEPIGYAHAEFR